MIRRLVPLWSAAGSRSQLSSSARPASRPRDASDEIPSPRSAASRPAPRRVCHGEEERHGSGSHVITSNGQRCSTEKTPTSGSEVPSRSRRPEESREKAGRLQGATPAVAARSSASPIAPRSRLFAHRFAASRGSCGVLLQMNHSRSTPRVGPNWNQLRSGICRALLA